MLGSLTVDERSAAPALTIFGTCTGIIRGVSSVCPCAPVCPVLVPVPELVPVSFYRYQCTSKVFSSPRRPKPSPLRLERPFDCHLYVVKVPAAAPGSFCIAHHASVAATKTSEQIAWQLGIHRCARHAHAVFSYRESGHAFSQARALFESAWPADVGGRHGAAVLPFSCTCDQRARCSSELWLHYPASGHLGCCRLLARGAARLANTTGMRGVHLLRQRCDQLLQRATGAHERGRRGALHDTSVCTPPARGHRLRPATRRA